VSDRPTFAEWQFSHRIVPWTIVHDWSEFDYLVGRTTKQFLSVQRRVMEPLVEAFSRAAEALATIAAALSPEETQ
jgi:hypothetical protein